MTWDDLTSGQQYTVIERVRTRLSTLNAPIPGDIDLTVRVIADAVSEEMPDDDHEQGFDLGWEAGLEAGKDEGYAQAVAEIRALAEDAA